MEDHVVKVENHYEILLPQRNPEMTLPNKSDGWKMSTLSKKEISERWTVFQSL